MSNMNQHIRRLLKVIVLFSALHCVFVQESFAQSATASTMKVYVQRPFRIWYQDSSMLMQNFQDLNKNGIPDQVEDIAMQLQAARYFFHVVYDFADPLKSERHALRPPTYIDVRIRPYAYFKNGKSVVFSSSTQAINAPKGVWSLKIHLSDLLYPSKNTSPAREYFRLVQYGSTYFRNNWFFDGVSRWSEDIITDSKKHYVRTALRNALIETDDGSFDRLMSYNARDYIWAPFVERCGKKSRLSDKLATRFKYVNGKSVLKDNYIYGADLMSDFMKCLKDKEEAASKHFESREEWLEEGLRAVSNTQYIKSCIIEKLENCESTGVTR